MVKKTIISDEKEHEIIKLENTETKYSIIIYAYNNRGVVIDGTKNEPYILSTYSRDIFLRILNIPGFDIDVFAMHHGIEGKKLSSLSEAYYIAKVVLDLVNMENKKDNSFVYSGNKVSMNKNTKYYDFKFDNGKTISIRASLLYDVLTNNISYKRFIDGRKTFTMGIRTRNDESYVLLYKDVNNNKEYIIKLTDIDINNINLYQLVKNLTNNNPSKFYSAHIIHDSVMIVSKCGDKNFYLTIPLDEAFDAFTNRGAGSPCELNIGGYKAELTGHVLYNPHNAFNRINVGLSLFDDPINFDIIADNDFYKIFKEALLKRVGEH